MIRLLSFVGGARLGAISLGSRRMRRANASLSDRSNARDFLAPVALRRVVGSVNERGSSVNRSSSKRQQIVSMTAAHARVIVLRPFIECPLNALLTAMGCGGTQVPNATEGGARIGGSGPVRVAPSRHRGPREVRGMAVR